MRGGAIAEDAIGPTHLKDGAYICGSELINKEVLLKDYEIVPLGDARIGDATNNNVKGLYKANGNHYLIKKDKVPTRVTAEGVAIPLIYVQKTDGSP
jgi:hypothetical protein